MVNDKDKTMRILPFRRKRIDRNLVVYVSNYFHYTDFGVRDTDDRRRFGRRFIMAATPGTGFFERESESRSYHDFVRRQVARQRHIYWRLLTGREPNYDKELQLASEALKAAEEPRRRELLECYVNALTVGRDEELLERLIRAVKNKMRHRSNKYLVSVIGHYKHKIRQLEHDMEAVEYRVEDHYSPEVCAAYREATEAFGKMVNRCRRVWHHNEKVYDNFAQVFFDLGTFDFIRTDNYMPLMRDSVGRTYYLLPDAMIVARGSLDFDLVPLKTLTVVYQETSIAETTDLLSVRVGDAACMMLIPELGLTFYFNHAQVVVEFVHALDKLKALL